MEVVKTKHNLKRQLSFSGKKTTLGFVPTMGALHKGHLSLVEHAVKENDIVVVSIFVNPAQFNNNSDLKRYPRNLDSDLKLLENTGCDIVFSPTIKEMYPEPDNRIFDFGHLGKVMEGKYRPGHFNGVAKIVSKLFDVVKPQNAYFGLKDFQQLAVVKELARRMYPDIRIVVCPIIRENDGLAMSSRNLLLSIAQRNEAVRIYKTLVKAKKLIHHKSVSELTGWVTETINKNALLDVEYFEIVDDESLLPVTNWEEPAIKVGCIAVNCGDVRLIDNIVF